MSGRRVVAPTYLSVPIRRANTNRLGAFDARSTAGRHDRAWRSPKVRDGSCSPSLLEPWRVERASLAVVQEDYVLGASARAGWRSSLAAERNPYLWLDATYVKVTEGGRVISMAALVATGVVPTGERRILAGQSRWAPAACQP